MKTRIIKRFECCGGVGFHAPFCEVHKLPKKGEHWTVEYGMKPIRIIVKVTGNPILEKGWHQDFKCDREGNETLVKGTCFKERWDEINKL